MANTMWGFPKKKEYDSSYKDYGILGVYIGVPLFWEITRLDSVSTADTAVFIVFSMPRMLSELIPFLSCASISKLAVRTHAPRSYTNITLVVLVPSSAHAPNSFWL